MNSVELIRKLSSQGAEDFSIALSWINPIPNDASELTSKMEMALQRLQYAQDRQGSSKSDDTSKQRAVVSRLKTEIEGILGSS